MASILTRFHNRIPALYRCASIVNPFAGGVANPIGTRNKLELNIRHSSSSFSTSGEEAVFAGASTEYTHELQVISADDLPSIPCYSLLGSDGAILNEAEEPDVPGDVLVQWHREMITLNIMDSILYNSQRQGQISFYMTAFGEEATHIGSAAALSLDDIVYGQYREQGVFLHRGFTMKEIMDQCFGNVEGHGKGRQMPVHYGSKKLNFHTISSPLATQMPQATGAAYAIKGSGNCVMCYFGDGAASEGDAHPAFNFAATLECPIVFFCRNNGWAISTPIKEQYRGDGVASRAFGYGMDVIRVDGFDVLAVYEATKAAREIAIKESRPVLVEALTYRVGHHSTSDDASAYRSDDELHSFAPDPASAINRFHTYLKRKGYSDDETFTRMQAEAKAEVLKYFRAAGDVKLPSIGSLFDDVFDELPPHLVRQKKEIFEHIAKYPSEYPTENKAEE